MVRAATSLHSSSLSTNWIHVLIHLETNSPRNMKPHQAASLCTNESSGEVHLTSQSRALSYRRAAGH